MSGYKSKSVSLSGRSMCGRWSLCNLITLAMILQCAVISEPMRGQVATPANEQKTTIHGVVTNSVTHEPVGHALVFSGDGRLGTLTDDQGRFEFVLPQTADAGSREGSTGSEVTVSFTGGGFGGWLNARKPGFLDSTDPFARRWGQIPATGVPPAPGVELTIPLTPEALIFGKVNLPGATGADRITVQLQRRRVVDGRARWEEATAVNTRANGEFRLFGLEAGTYKLLTNEVMDRDPLTADPRGPMMGYPPVYFPNASDFQSAGTIELKAGATFQAELSPVRQAYYPVKIPIANPPEGSYVEVAVQGQKGPGFELGYNQAEQRIEGSLPNGRYVVEAFSDGEQPAFGLASIMIEGGAVEAPAMTLAPGSFVQVKANADFKQNAETLAQGEIEDREKFPSLEAQGQNLRVRLQPEDETVTRHSGIWSTTAGGDVLTFGRLLPGQYWVKMDALRGYVAAATLGDVDLLRRPLRVGRGETLTVEVTLRDDGAEIAGTIEGLNAPEGAEAKVGEATSEPAAYVYCVPLPDSSGQFRQSRVVRDGKFDLKQVAPGAYRVMAFAHPQNEMEYHNSEAMRAHDTMGQVVRVNAGQKESLRLPLLAGSE